MEPERKRRHAKQTSPRKGAGFFSAQYIDLTCTVLGDTGGESMAKSRKSSKVTRRDTSAIASDRLRSLLAFSLPRRSGPTLLEVEDRRQFNPGVLRARTISTRPAVTSMRAPPPRKPARGKARRRKVPSLFRGPEIHAFEIPRSTLVCVRRAVRKEVLHAKRKAGKAVRRPKRNALSAVSCKWRK